MQLVKQYLLIMVSLHRKYFLNWLGNYNLCEKDNEDEFTFCQVHLVRAFDMMNLLLNDLTELAQIHINIFKKY